MAGKVPPMLSSTKTATWKCNGDSAPESLVMPRSVKLVATPGVHSPTKWSRNLLDDSVLLTLTTLWKSSLTIQGIHILKFSVRSRRKFYFGSQWNYILKSQPSNSEIWYNEIFWLKWSYKSSTWRGTNSTYTALHPPYSSVLPKVEPALSVTETGLSLAKSYSYLTYTWSCCWLVFKSPDTKSTHEEAGS